MSVEEFERLPKDGMRHELIRGELTTMPPARLRHSDAASELFLELGNACKKSGRYKAYAEAGFRLSPDTILQPDVAVVSQERRKGSDPDGYIWGAPDLAIEVASPSNSQEEFEEKMSLYFQYGSRQVWMVYTKTRHVHTFEAGHSTARVLSESDALTTDLLPGWSMPVRAIFE